MSCKSARAIKRSKNVIKKKDDSFLMETKNYASKFMQTLNETRSSKQLVDVTLVAEGGDISAHRLILSLSSEYFRCMFSANMKESSTSEVPMVGCDYDIVKIIVDFFYTGVFKAFNDQLPRLLQLCDMLQLDELKEICSQQLEQHVNPMNCLGIWHYRNRKTFIYIFFQGLWQFAEQVRAETLQLQCERLIVSRFPTVSQSEEFLSLDLNPLLRVSHLKNLNCEREKINTEDEKSQLREILLSVQWNGVCEEVNTQVMQHDLVKDNQDLCNGIREAKEREFHERSVGTGIYVIGGYLQSRTGPLCPRVNTVEHLSLNTDGKQEWISMKSLPDSASSIQAFNFHGQLLCLLTFPDSSNSRIPALTLWYTYHPLTNEWFNVTHTFGEEATKSLQTCVEKQGVLCYDSKSSALYACTGKTCAKYSVSLNTDDDSLSIAKVKDLPSECAELLEGHAVVVCEDKLYLLGGQYQTTKVNNDNQPRINLSRCEDTHWTPLSGMNTPRAHFAAVAIDGYIIAMGGTTGLHRLDTCEQYSIFSENWFQIKSMERPRTHFSATTVNGEVYVMGGKSYANRFGGARKVLKTCEIYDVKSRKWRSGPPLLGHRCWFGLTVL
ncbi:hypothetical protein CAPTEDRAFT_196617 [Capitella teleta]|uniref:BTB domain-containing protein n=1 Tax=Capitella teleta TaxID=283909 RepID=R7U6Z1_CAPTE|nr:hypothetical protein CAPTEDRAFT_196617 [Capitella teleta]|eukprot:ELU02130.1 hypothetical protein CAPTEDRAFT_196617 [Capitella teleta]